MEDKENIVKKPEKRKSSLLLDEFKDSKRLFTDIRDNISENDASFSSIDINCDTPILHSENIFSSCLTKPFDECLVLTHKDTPEDLVSSTEKLSKVTLERCLSDGICSEARFNDSFEILRSKMMRSQTMTPISFGLHNTPETPCDLHQIDLDKMGAICELGRNSLIYADENESDEIFRRPALQKINTQISPIFYEYEPVKTTVRGVAPQISRPMMMNTNDDNSEYEIKIDEMSTELVSRIIDNDFSCQSYSYHIIDCRYPYEYDGGHIEGAVNLYTPFQILSYIFLSNYNVTEIQKPLINTEESLAKVMKEIMSFVKPPPSSKQVSFIFHCEFSSIRGPELARCLRNMDRLANLNKYPTLYFPRVFIMRKGYKEFYSKYKSQCKPSHYVKMDIIDPQRVKGESICGESDDEDELNKSSDIIDQETANDRLRIYNYCKRETQEQLRLFSQLANTQNFVDSTNDE